jgi:hypothetical protein
VAAHRFDGAVRCRDEDDIRFGGDCLGFLAARPGTDQCGDGLGRLESAAGKAAYGISGTVKPHGKGRAHPPATDDGDLGLHGLIPGQGACGALSRFAAFKVQNLVSGIVPFLFVRWGL